MAIVSAKDIADAFADGRVHTQRFLKNAGLAGDGQWQDWAYASGQPAYDARIGDALTATPIVATRNDAIYFPPISGTQERRLLEMRCYTTAGGTGQLTVSYELYDLLAVYPLIDGDNTDPQAMDNTAPLPRYTDGVGVRAVLVNHVAPGITAGCATNITYTDSDDTQRTVTVYTTTDGLGKAAWTQNAAGTGAMGDLYLPCDGPGVKQIDELTFTTAPGGLWAIYLVAPLARMDWQGGIAAVTQTLMVEKSLCTQDSFNLPRIYDGAHLGFFYMPNGSARTVATFGSATFAWG
jgi:hypothetical protein